MGPFFVVVVPIFLLMNLRIVKPVSITGNSGDEKSLDISKKKEKDNEKIKIESQNPKNYTLNFKNNEITVTFNKLIFLNSKLVKLQTKDNFKNIDEVFNISFENDKVILKFKNESYKKIGTFIITFVEGAIQDRYGNIMEDFSIIFSTNSNLNKYQIRGKVFDLLTKKELQNIYVFLYKVDENDIKNNISSRNIINNNKPEYFAKSNILGNYSFDNLSSGIYFLCAGEIDKENFMADPNIHKYGFVSKFIKIDDKNIEIEKDVYILKSLLHEFTITNESITTDKYIIETNDSIKDFNINIKENLLKRYSKYSKLLKKSSKIVDNKKIEIDNNILGLISTDFLPCNVTIKSENDEIIKKDILLKFNNSTLYDDDDDDDDDFYANNGNNDKDKNNQEFEIKALSQDLSVDSIFDFTIKTKKNVVSTDKTKFKIIISDGYNIVKTNFTDFKIVEEYNNIHIKTNKKLQDIVNDFVTKDNKYDILNKRDINVVVFVDKDAITYSDFSKNRTNMANFNFLRNFSSIDISFNIKSDHFKLQLLDEKYDVIKEISDSLVKDRTNITFKKIKNGRYLLRYFYWNDKEENKKSIWSTGNISKNIPNDPVDIYNKEILINSESTNEKIIIE